MPLTSSVQENANNCQLSQLNNSFPHLKPFCPQVKIGFWKMLSLSSHWWIHLLETELWPLYSVLYNIRVSSSPQEKLDIGWQNILRLAGRPDRYNLAKTKWRLFPRVGWSEGRLPLLHPRLFSFYYKKAELLIDLELLI